MITIFPRQLWDELDEQFQLRESYAGRAMYGANCIGLVGELGDLIRFVAACQNTAEQLDIDGQELLHELADTVRSDNMGYQNIYYFPGVELEPTTDSR